MSARPFRFGVKLRHSDSAAEWQQRVRHIEALGYASISTPDHLGPQLAPLIAATAAACATTRLRVGTSVLGNDFRHPVVLAKEAASLDLLSEGRFELGLGAGWMESDYRALGNTMESPGTRIERLGEASQKKSRSVRVAREVVVVRHVQVREQAVDVQTRFLTAGGLAENAEHRNL